MREASPGRGGCVWAYSQIEPSSQMTTPEYSSPVKRKTPEVDHPWKIDR